MAGSAVEDARAGEPWDALVSRALCRTCKAAVIWATTERGESMPEEYFDDASPLPTANDLSLSAEDDAFQPGAGDR